MKKYFIVLVLLSKLAVSQNKTTTIYLIRHAEKAESKKANESNNPDLSEMGQMRASHWDDVFSAVHFDFIFSTNYKRTQQTAAPTALTQKVTVTTYDPKELTAVRIKRNYEGKTLLIVGHSNTIPDLVNKLIDQKVYTLIEETTFGNLYIITINGDITNHQLLRNL